MQTKTARDGSANAGTTFKLPMRCAFKPDNGGRRAVIKGTPGSHGDAGWTVVEFPTRESRAKTMLEYPEARMPCWNRIERGEV